jgi:hypothetical protein
MIVSASPLIKVVSNHQMDDWPVLHTIKRKE